MEMQSGVIINRSVENLGVAVVVCLHYNLNGHLNFIKDMHSVYFNVYN